MVAGLGNPYPLRLGYCLSPWIDANQITTPADYAGVWVSAQCVNAKFGAGNWFNGMTIHVLDAGTQTEWVRV